MHDCRSPCCTPRVTIDAAAVNKQADLLTHTLSSTWQVALPRTQRKSVVTQAGFIGSPENLVRLMMMHCTFLLGDLIAVASDRVLFLLSQHTQHTLCAHHRS